MKNALVIFGMLLFTLNISFGQATTVHKDFVQNVDSSKKQFAKHFKVLDKRAGKNKKSSNTAVLYCCQPAVLFMAYQTGIQPGTIGNRLGYPGFTKSVVTLWHQWYKKNIEHAISPTAPLKK